MPWYLETLLVAVLVLAPAHAYVLWRGFRAVRRLLPGLNRFALFVCAGLLELLLLCGPLVALGAFRLAEAGRFLPASQTLVGRILYGHPATDPFFVYPFWFGLIATIQLGPLLVCWEILLRFAPVERFLKHGSESISWLTSLSGDRLRAALVIAFLSLGAIYVAGRMYLDTNFVRTRELKVVVPDLAPELEGLRIAHISDVQADYYTAGAKLDRYARAINDLYPDLVAFSGDLITRDPDHVRPGAAMLGRLDARLGVFACLGDHDVWYAPGKIRYELRRAGAVLREDGNAFVNFRGRRIALSILTTTYRRRPSVPRLRRLDRQTRGADLRIMIGHQSPDEIVDFARRAGYSLFLGGHTHGGQVAFSYFGWELSASQKETNYVSGLYRAGEMPVHVNNGLGLTLAPIRFQAPATATLLVLTAGEARK